MTLRIYQSARRDIERAFDYIAQDSPRNAQIVVERMLAALEALPDNPGIGRPGRVPGTRELVITPTGYIAVYQVTASGVAIVRVIHGRQNWP